MIDWLVRLVAVLVIGGFAFGIVAGIVLSTQDEEELFDDWEDDAPVIDFTRAQEARACRQRRLREPT